MLEKSGNLDVETLEKVAMLYRKITTEFEKWFKKTNKKALFAQGARHVGKTTTIREFCRSHY